MRNTMKKTMGEKISQLRKQKGMTQDELAEVMNVTSQAVSKWENDLSIPDLSILLELSTYFHISLDDLLKEKEETVRYVSQENRKDINEMFLLVNVLTNRGDKVKVNLPMAIVKMALALGREIPEFNANAALKNIDLNLIIHMIENGAIGKLVEVETVDGDIVEVFVE